MKKYPSEYKLENLLRTVNSNAVEIDGKWVPARSEGLSTISNRIKLAWKVFTGKADALTWPKGQ